MTERIAINWQCITRRFEKSAFERDINEENIIGTVGCVSSRIADCP